MIVYVRTVNDVPHMPFDNDERIADSTETLGAASSKQRDVTGFCASKINGFSVCPNDGDTLLCHGREPVQPRSNRPTSSLVVPNDSNDAGECAARSTCGDYAPRHGSHSHIVVARIK